MKTRPILKYPGAKWSASSWILDNLPVHEIYLEPFFGSGAIFFNKEPARLETVNDLDGNVVNLFKVIRERPQELATLVSLPRGLGMNTYPPMRSLVTRSRTHVAFLFDAGKHLEL